MCGIFGIVTKQGAIDNHSFRDSLERLFLLSETRGRESAGIAVITSKDIRYLKTAMRPKHLIASKEYSQFIEDAYKFPLIFAAFGHSRLVTNGGQNVHANNQPVESGQFIGVHNGIIVNDDYLWHSHPELQRQTDVDTEVLLRLFDIEATKGKSLVDAFRSASSLIEGVFSVCIASNKHNALMIATNNGSLYYVHDPERGLFAFASEHVILRRLLKLPLWSGLNVQHLVAGEAFLLALDTLALSPFTLQSGASPDIAPKLYPRRIYDATPDALRSVAQESSVPTYFTPDLSRFEIAPEPIRAIKRCTRCILPETVPFISFDEEGVCNVCKHHTPRNYKGKEALILEAEALKAKVQHADCLFTFSGGRDSIFCLHYAVKELGLKHVTYTYDWGLITDLARRNQARMCGALGIEHIIVSADIAAKRANVRRNVLAWLNRPSLGMIPLFMAGDKQYFYYANKVAAELGIESIMLAANPLEKTHFKAGFCGLPPALGHRPSRMAQAGMLAYYGGQVLANPSYINRSLIDTLGAFGSYYMIKHKHLRLFDYVPWVEEEVNGVLQSQYGWETAFDTQSTWRIGDGTAAFYNYIYYQVAGFTENDTFRSNQIREGAITRVKALQLIENENAARFDTLSWYASVIGFDLPSALTRIRSVPTLYPR
jgi:hypothetical protein